jgi:hypothetical protein
MFSSRKGQTSLNGEFDVQLCNWSMLGQPGKVGEITASTL